MYVLIAWGVDGVSEVVAEQLAQAYVDVRVVAPTGEWEGCERVGRTFADVGDAVVDAEAVWVDVPGEALTAELLDMLASAPRVVLRAPLGAASTMEGPGRTTLAIATVLEGLDLSAEVIVPGAEGAPLFVVGAGDVGRLAAQALFDEDFGSYVEISLPGQSAAELAEALAPAGVRAVRPSGQACAPLRPEAISEAWTTVAEWVSER